MIRLTKELAITKENFSKVQHQGKQSVRFMVVLFLLCLILYDFVQYILLKNMIPISALKGMQKTYLFYIIIQAVVWIIICIQLWKYSKLGRILFFVFSFVSIYLCKDIVNLYNLNITHIEIQMMRILFLFLFVCKSGLAIVCTWRLFANKKIRCIWSVYDLYEENLIGLDEDSESGSLNSSIQREVLETYEEEETQLNQRATRFIHRYVFWLLSIIYGCLLVIYVFMFYLQYLYPKDIDGLQYVQRTFLLACLYTVLIWMLPLIALFLKKRWCKQFIAMAWMIECVQFILSISQVFITFQSQHYGISSILAFIIVTLIRYMLLLRFTISFYRNPFMHVYWSKQSAIVKRKNKLRQQVKKTDD